MGRNCVCRKVEEVKSKGKCRLGDSEQMNSRKIKN